MNFQKFLTEKTNQNVQLPEIRTFLYKNYIKTIIEDTSSSKKRVSFISNRKKSNFSNPLSAEANGIITEYDEDLNKWEIIMVPTCNFNTSLIKMSNVEHFYNQKFYNVYKAYDGTIINLYYYRGEWKISTNKGYDVTNLPINEKYTYQELFLYLLSSYPEFNIDNLDINKTYTFCMKYDKIHLFKEINSSSNYIIFIQSVNLNENFNINENENIGLPIQEKYNNMLFVELFTNKKKSLNDYKNYFKNNNTNYENNYGYILKSNNKQITQQFSNIYLESELMKNIRKLIYDHRFLSEEIIQNNLYTYNMTLLNIIKNIITNNNDDFKKIFPQYSKKYDIVKQFLLNDLHLHILKNIKIYSKYYLSKKTIDTDNFYITQYNINEVNKLAYNIYIYIIHNSICINTNDGKSILIDLLDIKFIDSYYKCLISIFE